MKLDNILYEDKDIIVCHKPAGIATQTAKVGSPDMVSGITGYLTRGQRTGNGQSKAKPYVGLIHRLDQPVEGILVFAKNKKAAAGLSTQLQAGGLEKYYLAVVHLPDMLSQGVSASQEDIISSKNIAERMLTDYLYQDKSTNTSYVTDQGKTNAKLARLSYQIIKKQTVSKLVTAKQVAEPQNMNIQPEEAISIALLRIHLLTGRHHQIRVQLSNAGLCLLGDYKYADEETKVLSERLRQKQIALCAYKLAFLHPVTGKRLSFKIEPEGEIFRRNF